MCCFASSAAVGTSPYRVRLGAPIDGRWVERLLIQTRGRRFNGDTPQRQRRLLGIVVKYPISRRHPVALPFGSLRMVFTQGPVEPAGVARGSLNSARTLES